MRTLWLRLRAGWVTLTGTGAAATVAFGLLVFVAVLASLAIPRESVALRTGALQRVIAASSPADRTVVGTVAATSMGGDATVRQCHRGGRRILAGDAGCGRCAGGRRLAPSGPA